MSRTYTSIRPLNNLLPFAEYPLVLQYIIMMMMMMMIIIIIIIIIKIILIICLQDFKNI